MAKKPAPSKKTTSAEAAKAALAKRVQLIAMLERKSGATIAVASEKFGWQQHTTRAADLLSDRLSELEGSDRQGFVARWQELVDSSPQPHASMTLPRGAVAYELQTNALGSGSSACSQQLFDPRITAEPMSPSRPQVDRLTRSLPDFSRLIERLDKAKASFVSVTQSFNTATSMGRLTLNVLLSFAQFEREVTAERIRDKIAASKKKGMWMGGPVPLGYDARDRTLVAREDEAAIVRQIYDLYFKLGTFHGTKTAADRHGLRSRLWTSKAGNDRGGLPFTRGHLYRILTNPIYVGMVHHKGATYEGQHDSIVDPAIWQGVQDQLRIGETRVSADASSPDEAEPMDGSGSADDIDGQEAQDAAPASDPKPSPARPKRSYRTEPSPLVGKVFDETGDHLTPSHANKKGRRYRYYISNRLIARSGEVDYDEGEVDSECSE